MNGKSPVIDPTVYIATNASVVGDVQIATGSAVWYGSSVRGDNNSVVIGTESHIQDRAIVSGVKSTDNGLPGSVSIGNNVVVGKSIHSYLVIGYCSVLTGCRIDDNVRIGSNCRVLEGAHMEANSSLGSGSVVEQGKTIPAGEVFILFGLFMYSTGQVIPLSLSERLVSTRRTIRSSILVTVQKQVRNTLLSSFLMVPYLEMNKIITITYIVS